MSVETIHNSIEIDNMFLELGLENNNNLKKSEKCRIIRNFNYDLNYASIYPESYKSIIHTDTPMLCMRMKQLEQKEQTEIWKSDNYIAEEKIDGLRCYIAYNYNYDLNNGYEFFSRENNESTLLPKNITNLITRKINRPDKFYKSFLLDCELVLLENGLFEIYCFDCLFFNDNYIIDETWFFRRYITEHIVESIFDSCIKTTRYTKIKKIDFYNYIKSIGGEGVVIKNINSKYTSKGSRSKYNWIKVKGNIFDYSIIEDTLEGYVSDNISETNTVSLSAFIDDREISNKIAIIPLEYFTGIQSCSYFNTNLKLGLGSVIEFSSSFFSMKEYLFKNTFPIKIRMDKSIKDCHYLNSDIQRWSA